MNKTKVEKKYTYTKFDGYELDVFCNILDVDKTGVINLADLEAAAKNLGLESIYQDIRNLLKSMIDMDKGGIPVKILKEYLKSYEKSFDDEMSEIFDYFDYDKKGSLSKHKLKIIAGELIDEEIADQEADEMIKLFTTNGENTMSLQEFKDLEKLEMDV